MFYSSLAFHSCCCCECADAPSHTTKEEKHGSVKLPDTCLCRIMECLVEGLEPGGLRGPSAVAADLGAVSLVGGVS